tara:strand:- start:1532 stop:2935 length:1404 start_codon:yes stop_codon:yes gene_type:complete
MSVSTKFPVEIGPIHFIGIGGIGMSGIAEILINQGYTVQGSDLKETEITSRLERMGASIKIGHNKNNLMNVAVVVISSAINSDNPELNYARSAGLPVVRRAEMLAELMRMKSNVAIAGTHGKTTTTTLVATLLDEGGFDPTVINGGIIHAYGSNARAGAGEWMVVEADESDGTFTRLPATIALITNIDPEHLEHWGDFDALRQGFLDFISNIPFYGVAVCCSDHPEVQKLIDKISDRQIKTFGLNAQADIRAINLHYDEGRAHFDIKFQKENCTITDCILPMPGDYNVSNALGAVAVAHHLGVENNKIREALAYFKGVNRRFTKVGELNGITFIDDYAHHPVEISAVLRAARQISSGRIIAVHQPHRYTRLGTLFKDFCLCFNDADIVAISDVYSAGEQKIPGVSKDDLVTGLIHHSHRHAVAVSNLQELSKLVADNAQSGDLVIFLGAGNISSWASELPKLLCNEY